MNGELIEFPGAKAEVKATVPAPGELPSGRVRMIDRMPPAKTERVKASPAVTVGAMTRGCINQIGQWLDHIDCMRGQVNDTDMAMQLSVIEAALAGIVFMHAPKGGKTA
jgi:hypothetical protein